MVPDTAFATSSAALEAAAVAAATAAAELAEPFSLLSCVGLKEGAGWCLCEFRTLNLGAEEAESYLTDG